MCVPGGGGAVVECEQCYCDPTKLDGHHKKHESQLFYHTFFASRHANCTVKVRSSPHRTHACEFLWHVMDHGWSWQGMRENAMRCASRP